MRFYSIKLPILGPIVEAWYRLTTPANAAVATVIERERMRRHHLFSLINLIIVICLIELLIINSVRADLSLVTVDTFVVIGMSLGLWFNRQGQLETAAWFCITTYIIGCTVGMWTPYFLQPNTIPWGWVEAILPTLIVGQFLRPRVCLIITVIEYAITYVYLISHAQHIGADLNYILLYASFTIIGSGISSTLYAASALEILQLADRTVELEHAHALIHESLSALQESYATLEHEAATDPLTGVANRRTAQGVISQKLLDMQIHVDQMLSLIFMDIDHFKAINDTYGHDVGDVALQHLASFVESFVPQFLDSPIRDSEIRYQLAPQQPRFWLARLGGEEFVLILPEIPTEYAASIAEELRVALLATPFRYNDQAITMTMSQGVATAPYHATTMTDLFAQADAAMYAAKRGGRNRVCVAGMEWGDQAA